MRTPLDQNEVPIGSERKGLILATLCLTVLISVVDNSVLNVALPAMSQDLGATTGELQWIVDSYVVVFAGLLLTAGAIGDRYGRRGALNGGLLIVAACSLLATQADSAAQLIGLRAVMGIGGALAFPATLSILANVFTDPIERGRAVALWGATAGVGVALGPVLGGVLLERFWWGSVFLVTGGIALAAAIAGRRVLPTSRDPQARPIDLVGAVTSSAALVALVWGIIEAQHGWTSTNALVSFLLSAVAFVIFIWWEQVTDEPMLPLDVFSNFRFTASSFALMTTFFAINGVFFQLTLFLQVFQGLSALDVGLRGLGTAAGMIVAAPSGARLAERVGTKLVVTAGLIVGAAATIWFSRFDIATGTLEVVAALTLFGLGLGLITAPATEAILGTLPKERAGVGSAMNDVTRQLGSALGVAVTGTMLGSAHQMESGEAGAAASGIADGMSSGMIVVAALLGVGALVSAAFLPARADETVR